MVVYLVFKVVRLWRYHSAYRTHRMSPGELKRRMEVRHPLVVVGLRAAFERIEGCIPGAMAVAYKDLYSLLPLIGAREVVFYCSCPREISSVRAALRLKRHGLTRLHTLQGGFAGWRALGFPVDTHCRAAARA